MTADRRPGAMAIEWAQVIVRLQEIELRKLSLTYRQFRILKRVDEGHTSGAALSRFFGISQAAVSDAVDIVERRGLVTRTARADDRRGSEIALTPQGARLLAAAEAAERTLADEAFGDLGDEECRALGGAIERLLASGRERLLGRRQRT